MSEVTQVPKRILLDLSPFEVDFSTVKPVKKVSLKSGKGYIMYNVVVNALGGEGKYGVELFEGEYLRLKILNIESRVKAFSAESKPNAKTGYDDMLFSPFNTV